MHDLKTPIVVVLYRLGNGHEPVSSFLCREKHSDDRASGLRSDVTTFVCKCCELSYHGMRCEIEHRDRYRDL